MVIKTLLSFLPNFDIYALILACGRRRGHCYTFTLRLRAIIFGFYMHFELPKSSWVMLVLCWHHKTVFEIFLPATCLI